MVDTETRMFGTGEVICAQGEPSDGLYILRRGRVAAVMNPDADTPTRDDINAKGIQLSILDTEGEFIGESGIFLKRRTASLVAMEANTTIEVIPIDNAHLSRVMLQNHHLSVTLCHGLARRVSGMMERLHDVMAVAEEVDRTNEHYAVQYWSLLKRVSKLEAQHDNLKGLAELFLERPIAILGKSIEQRRNDTSALFNAHVAQGRRSGTVKLAAGEVLCEAGQMGRALYHVQDGAVDVLINNKIVTTIPSGEIVGEIAVLLKEMPKRTATVRARMPSVVSCIPTVEFYELVKQKPELLVIIGRLLAKRLQTANGLLCSQFYQRLDRVDPLVAERDDFRQAYADFVDSLRNYLELAPLAEEAEGLLVEFDRAREELAKKQSIIFPN